MYQKCYKGNPISVDEYSVFCVRGKGISYASEYAFPPLVPHHNLHIKRSEISTVVILTPQPHPHPQAHQHSAANTSTDLSLGHRPAVGNPPHLDAYSTAS
jgi:hypothetical protein